MCNINMHIAEYMIHRACLREVDKSLHCFGSYPHVIRLADWKKATEEKSLQNVQDRYETDLDVVYYGLSVHL